MPQAYLIATRLSEDSYTRAHQNLSIASGQHQLTRALQCSSPIKVQSLPKATLPTQTWIVFPYFLTQGSNPNWYTVLHSVCKWQTHPGGPVSTQAIGCPTPLDGDGLQGTKIRKT